MHVINIPQIKFLRMIVQLKIFSHLIINYALNE